MSHKCIIEPHVIKFIPINIEGLDPTSNYYGFDLDYTLIQPKTANAIFGKTADDWKFMHFQNDKSTLDILIEISKKDSKGQFVIFTNQGGVITVPKNSKSCHKFTVKIKLLLDYIKTIDGGQSLLSRLWLYSSTMKPAALFPRKTSKAKKEAKIDKTQKTLSFLGASKTNEKIIIGTNENLTEKFDDMRKPRIGLAKEFINDLKTFNNSINSESMNWIYYCGDAAGRKKDFSDSDKAFADTLGVEFKVPEDVF